MSKGGFHLGLVDAVEWLADMPDACVDLMVTDPAYESLEKHRRIGTTTRLAMSKSSSNQWFDIFPNSRFPEFFTESFRVLKKDSHLYVMCDQETGFVIKPMAEDVGFRFWKAIVWDKVGIGMGYHYRARHEWVMFFEKGKRKLNDLSVPDVLAIKRVNGGYPTEKPVELSRALVRQSSVRGEWVCDPFMGSGSTGEAAITEGRNFAGNDISAYAVEGASIRLMELGAKHAPMPTPKGQARLL